MRRLLEALARDDLRWPFRLLLAAVFCVGFSIALGETLLGLCFLCTAVALGAERRGPRLPPVFFYALVFLGVALATAPFGLSPRAGLKEFSSFFWLLALPVAATLVTWPARTRTLLKTLAFGNAALALYLCVRNPLRAWLDVRAGLPHAANLFDAIVHHGSMTKGQILMAGIVATLALLWAERRQPRALAGWAALLALETVGLVVNFKRGSWFCVLALLLAFGAARRLWKLLVPAAVVVALLALTPPVRMRLRELGREFDIRGGGRLTMWFVTTPRIVREHPGGIGYGALHDPAVLERVAPEIEQGRNHLHANWAQVLAETGWLGLAAFAAWMARALVDKGRLLRHARGAPEEQRTWALALLLVLAGLMANGLVEYNFGDTEVMILYAVLMGAASRADGLNPEP